MNDLETRLQQALKAGDPPPRDPMFRVEALVRRERAAFRRRLRAAGAKALAAAILAALALSVISDLIGPGIGQLVLIAATGAALTLFLAAPHAGTLSMLRSLAHGWRLGSGRSHWF